MTLAAAAPPDTAACQANAAEPSVTVPLLGNPFRAVVSRDGCWVFVSLGGRAGTAGIGILKRSGGTIQLAHVARPSAAAGIVLTHDGKLLIAAEKSGPRFFDVAIPLVFRALSVFAAPSAARR